MWHQIIFCAISGCSLEKLTHAWYTFQFFNGNIFARSCFRDFALFLEFCEVFRVLHGIVVVLGGGGVFLVFGCSRMHVPWMLVPVFLEVLNAVTFVLLAISVHLREVNFNNFVSSLTRRVMNWKLALIFSAVLGVELAGKQSSLSNFDTSSGNLACYKRLQVVTKCRSFQIQLSISHFHPLALSSLFFNFHLKSARFHEPQYGQIPLD